MKNIPEYGLSEFTNKHSPPAFYSNDLKAHLESHKFVNTPHSHSTYITILFTRGNGEHQIDFERYPVKAGSIFLLNPGQVHCWTLSKETEGFVFFHTREFYNSVYANRKLEDFPFFYLSQNYPLIELYGHSLQKAIYWFKEIN
jgi:AraC family transcriptional regulator, transcriptional activator of pobA